MNSELSGNDISDAIPRYDSMGRLLSQDEREQIARRKGICVRCGIKTHSGTFKRAVTDNNVHKGICIRCNPQAVPEKVLDAWKERNQTATVSTVANGSPSRMQTAAKKVINARKLSPNVTRSVQKGPSATNMSSSSLPHSLPNRHHGGPSSSNRLNRLTGNERSTGSVSAQPPPRRLITPGNPTKKTSSSSLQSGSNHTLQASNHALQSSKSSLDDSERSLSLSQASLSLKNAPDGRMNLSNELLGGRPSSQSQFDVSMHASMHMCNFDDWTGGEQEMIEQKHIAQALQSTRNAPIRLRNMLHMIRNTMENDDESILQILKEVMGQGVHDARTIDVACGAVWKVAAFGDEKKAQVVEVGIVPVIVDALRAHKEDSVCLEWVLGALTCVANCSCREHTKSDLARAGVIEAVVELLEINQASAGLLEWASRCLYVMITHYDDDFDGDQMPEDASQTLQRNIASIVEASGVQALLSCMKRHVSESGAQTWALLVLCRLLDRPEENQRNLSLKKISRNGFGPLGIKLLRLPSTSGELFRLVASLMAAVLGGDGDETESFESVSESVPSLLRRLEEDKDDLGIQASCCQLLSALCTRTENAIVKESLRDMKGLDGIVKTMTPLIDDVNSIKMACWGLWRASAEADVISSDLANRALEAMKEVTELHDSVDVLEAVCGFAVNVYKLDGVASEYFPSRAMALGLQATSSKTVGIAMKAYNAFATSHPSASASIVHAHDLVELVPKLRESAGDRYAICTFLKHSAQSSPDVRCTLIEHGILPTIVDLLQEPSSEEWKCQLLGLLAINWRSDDNGVVSFPGQVIQTLTRLQSSAGSQNLSSLCCKCFRNILLQTSSSGLNIIGLVDTLTGLIGSPKTSKPTVIEACGALWALLGTRDNVPPANIATAFKTLIGVTSKFLDNFDIEVQATASGALAATCAAAVTAHVEVISKDVDTVMSVIYKMIDTKSQEPHTMCNLISTLYYLCLVKEQVLIECGVIVAAIDVMVAYEVDAAIQEQGTRLLAKLASAENLQINFSIAQTDGIELLVSALAVLGDNEAVATQACKALSHLSIDPELRMMIASQGGLQLIVIAVTSHQNCARMLEFSVATLLNLTFDSDYSLYADSGIIDAIIQTMKSHPRAGNILESCMGILQNISMRGPEAKAAIGDAGGVEQVVSALKNSMGLPSVVERALSTIWSLSVLEANQTRVAEVGGVSLVVCSLMAFVEYDRVQKQGCGCLCTLAANSTNNILLRDAGALDAIIFAMWSHFSFEELQAEACRALCTLAHDATTGTTLVVTGTEIGVIVSTMQRFPSSPLVQEQACNSLRNLMLSADNVASARTHEPEIRTLVGQASSFFPNECAEVAGSILSCF